MTAILSNLSVDCVVFGFDGENLNILLIERELKSESGEILIQDHTLTGYHIAPNEELDAAAHHILQQLTGLRDIYLEQVYTFGGTQRLMNEKDQLWIKHHNPKIDKRTFTVVYYALIDNTRVNIQNNERKAQWFPIDDIPELGFDHKEIITKTREMLINKARLNPIIFELLPEKFTLSQLQKAYEAVLNTQFDRRNFRKKVAQMKFIIPLDEKQKGVAHKPAQLYFFSREVYDRTHKDRSLIAI